MPWICSWGGVCHRLLVSLNYSFSIYFLDFPGKKCTKSLESSISRLQAWVGSGRWTPSTSINWAIWLSDWWFINLIGDAKMCWQLCLCAGKPHIEAMEYRARRARYHEGSWWPFVWRLVDHGGSWWICRPTRTLYPAVPHGAFEEASMNLTEWTGPSQIKLQDEYQRLTTNASQ